MKNLIKNLLLAGGAALAISGCGGSGESPVAPASRAQIVGALSAGFQTRSLSEKLSTDQLPGTRTDEAAPEFDEEYKLWARPEPLRRDFFLDQAMTQPAGLERWNLTELWNGYDASWSIQITQGEKSGFEMEADTAVRDGRTTFSASGRDERGRQFRGSGASIDNGFTLDWSLEGPDGNPWRYRVTVLESGVTTLEYSRSRSLRFTLNFNGDGSGNGTISGVSDLLPANVTWNTAGTGKITFADNTEATFENFEFPTTTL